MTAIAAFVILVVAASIYWGIPRLRLRQVPDVRSLLRLTQIAGLKNERNKDLSWARFSPDGRMIAFSTPGNESSISIMQIGGGDPVEVTKDQCKNSTPVWSPDAQRIAFLSDRGNQVGIWSIPFLGGPPVLMKTLEPNSTSMKGQPPLLTKWGDNGATIYYEWNCNLFALDVNSKQLSRLLDFDPSIEAPREFRIAPDDNHIAFVARKDGQPDLWVFSKSSGQVSRITNDSAIDRSPVWHADGNRIIYSSYRNGFFQICSIHSDGRQPQQITFGDTDARVSDVSADGGRILYEAAKDESDLWETKTGTGQEIQITSDIGVEF